MIVFKYKKSNVSTSNRGGNIHSLNEGENNLSYGLNDIWIKSDGTPVNMELVTTAVEAALQDLAIHHPSIEKILKHKDILYTDHPKIRTMATDGISIFINPAYAEKLVNDFDIPALEYVLIHESLHILFDHCNKHAANMDKYSDPDVVNRAQDYEINFIIEHFMKEGNGTAPFKGLTDKLNGCYNKEWGKKGLTWEEIYPLVPKIKRSMNPEKTSAEWKKGFLDGYNAIIQKLRKENLIESYEI